MAVDEERLVAAARNSAWENGERKNERDSSGHVARWSSEKMHALLMILPRKQIWGLRQQKGAQYSAIKCSYEKVAEQVIEVAQYMATINVVLNFMLVTAHYYALEKCILWHFLLFGCSV